MAKAIRRFLSHVCMWLKVPQHKPKPNTLSWKPQLLPFVPAPAIQAKQKATEFLSPI